MFHWLSQPGALASSSYSNDIYYNSVLSLPGPSCILEVAFFSGWRG
ncbi:unnamed protein product [Nyctereutes procyonoides]|uniref:(raccoon dog) hypothetical protein n=1 Tax=Nyctereutes procyonoides TaxID=34880 RepID=A0A811YZ31_NYCPR|nr:unnamed protein product [Nyctereutes procyonoides]